MEPYRTLFPQAGRRLPVTERIVEQVICLPTGTFVQVEDVEAICHMVKLVLAHPEQVNARLPGELS
jgi:dTDP-4-amino-4,6-dideoxygalactose transaminase